MSDSISVALSLFGVESDMLADAGVLTRGVLEPLFGVRCMVLGVRRGVTSGVLLPGSLCEGDGEGV